MGGVVRESNLLWVSLLNKSMSENVDEHYSFKFSFTKHKYVRTKVYISEKEVEEFKKLLAKHDKDLRKVIEGYKKDIEKLISFCDKSTTKKYTDISFEEFEEIITTMLPVIGQTMPIAYCIDQYLQNKVLKLLKREFGEEAENCLRKISIPSKSNLVVIELREVLEVAAKETDIKEKSMDLSRKYGWFNIRQFVGEPFPPEYYESRINELRDTAKDQLSEYEQQEEILRESSENVISKVKNKELIETIRTLQEFIYIRTAKKDSLNYMGLIMKQVIEALNKKLGVDNAFLLTYWEIEDALKNNKKVDNQIFLNRKKGFNSLFDKKLTILDWEDTSLEEEIDIASSNEVKGMVAFKGNIKGKVIVINNREELSKMEKGAILVTPLTTPNFISAVEKCSGIVTDEGGLTCHAAIISREMKKPCIIGTKYATKIFKDNDIIELDTEKGVVRKIK